MEPTLHSLENCCHWNVDKQIELVGGESIRGVYVLHSDVLNDYQYIDHTVWKFGNCVVDITPFEDNRQYNCFYPINIHFKNVYGIEIYDIINNCSFMNKDTVMSYYVYGLLDPITKHVFYVGNGKGDRSESHFSEQTIKKYKFRKDKNIHDRKMDKIISLSSKGLEPIVIYYAENIENETVAYQYEEKIIRKFGRRDIDDGGILLNICLGSNPPNHSGKTYSEIMAPKATIKLKERKLPYEVA